MKALAWLEIHAAALKARAKSSWQKVRFGTITESVKSVDGGCASEVEYRGRNDKVIGYWAYGHFDPKYPYQG